MRAVGIIAEYNPLHNGHAYLLEEARKIAGNDAVVVAMSGNFVQRGEPAILDKWERAAIAVKNGADVVLEIPTLFCLADAGTYASAGIDILESLGCIDSLVFGSESADVGYLEKAAENLKTYQNELQELTGKYASSGSSYPRARSMAYRELFPSQQGLPDTPNDILALEYIKACKTIRPYAVLRKGNGHDSMKLSGENDMISASAIREMLRQGNDVRKYVTSATAEKLRSSILTFPNDWFDILKFCIMNCDAEMIDECPSGDNGLGNRIKSLIYDAESWDDLAEKVKTKRYTYTRITRLFMQIILGIRRSDYTTDRPQYIRILALSSRGRKLISEAGKSSDCILPVITNISGQKKLLGEEGLRQLELDAHAADVYNHLTGRNVRDCSDYRRSPEILD